MAPQTKEVTNEGLIAEEEEEMEEVEEVEDPQVTLDGSTPVGEGTGQRR